MLTVTRARVKEKCGVDDTSLDATIDNLILELIPVLEHALADEALASADAGLQATLNLGATEVVCGELLLQMQRPVGARDVVRIGELRVQPSVAAAQEVLAAGYARLRPYLARDPFVGRASSVTIAPPETPEP